MHSFFGETRTAYVRVAILYIFSRVYLYCGTCIDSMMYIELRTAYNTKQFVLIFYNSNAQGSHFVP